MKKWLAVLIALLGALGVSHGKTEWLETGARAVQKISAGRPQDLMDLLAGKEKQTQRQSVGRVGKKVYGGRITAVHDGDTLRITDTDGGRHKIRMAYIDAPELQQVYGTRSRDILRAAAQGRQADVTVFEPDRYGREVAQVSVDGTDLNLMQLERGAAWHYGAYAAKRQKPADYAAYARAQKQAEQARRGLWKDTSPQPPWDYRKEQRNGHESRNKDNGWFGLW